MIYVPTKKTPLPLGNTAIAARLEELADLLDAQGANPFRVRAYWVAARMLRSLQEPVHELLAREGTEGLMQFPGIGESLARSIERLARTGRLGLLEQLRGNTGVERALATVPGIGRKTAIRLREELGIENLAELEAAAYDGRLASFAGMGPKRLRGVRESLSGRFRRDGRVGTGPNREPTGDVPPVSELLEIDEQYRRLAVENHLPRIAPRRFNPTGEAWLPILHTIRGERNYTAAYSNTAHAHELGTIHDWVIIYRDDPNGEGQWTVVTSRFGNLKGHRIVRGREAECAEHYSVQSVMPTVAT